MNEKQRRLMFQLFTGTLVSQEIIVQALHRKGLVDKEEIASRLDYFIDYFTGRGAEQIAIPMRYLRRNLNRPFPDSPVKNGRVDRKYPDWFQGVISGGAGSSGMEERN